MIEAKVVNIIDNCTVLVVAKRSAVHALYKKVICKKKCFMCHYDNSICLSIDSKVNIIGCRPYSKRKKHRVVSVVL